MRIENTVGQKSKLYQLLFTLGNSYLERQQFSEAYDKLSQLLELEPDNPEVLELTSKAAIKIEKVTDEALDLYEKTLAKHTNPRQFIVELATLFEGNKINTAFSNEVLQKAKQLENGNGNEADFEPAEAEQFISNNTSVRNN